MLGSRIDPHDINNIALFNNSTSKCLIYVHNSETMILNRHS